jgi:dTDP-glucose 4,6-dehydratase
MILNMLEGKSLPVYGEGKNVRDWIYVADHASAIWAIMTHADAGATYNVGGDMELRNIDLVHRLCEVVAQETRVPVSEYTMRIRFVADRPGHDQRYAIDCSKIKRELGWQQQHSFEEGLHRTVRWYLENSSWVQGVRSGEYRKWLDVNYSQLGRT